MEVPKDRTVISWHFHGHLFSIFLGTPCSVSHQSRSKFIKHADSGVPISHIDPCPSIYIYNSSNNQNSTEFPHVQPFLRSTWDMKHTIPSHSTGWSMAYVIQEFHPLEVCSVYHVYMIILVLLIHIYIYVIVYVCLYTSYHHHHHHIYIYIYIDIYIHIYIYIYIYNE
jgi:hypothetical protein